MMMTIRRDNETIRNFSITKEKKEIIEKFLLLPTEHFTYGSITIDEILQEADIIIDFCESMDIEVF